MSPSQKNLLASEGGGQGNPVLLFLSKIVFTKNQATANRRGKTYWKGQPTGGGGALRHSVTKWYEVM
jgi:hypothetical protein